VVHPRLSYSSDRAISWQDLNPQGSFSAQALRDPSIMYVPDANPLLTGTFYFIVTPAVGTEVQFFSSADLMNFSPITTIDIAALVPGATVAWAPEWWHDPRDGQYYFFIAVSTDPEGASSSTAVMLPYLAPFNPSSARVGGAPVPIPPSGTTQKRTFDFFPYYDGSRYYLLYVDQQPGGSGGNVTQPIAFATSPTLAGPNMQRTFDGTDYFGLGTFHTEALAIFPLGETGCLRLVFDTWTVLAGGARQYAPVFRDSCRGEGAVFSQTSLIDGSTQLLISPSEHGTIIPLTDNRSAALVYRAVARARSN
jgi:hypothetical protein